MKSDSKPSPNPRRAVQASTAAVMSKKPAPLVSTLRHAVACRVGSANLRSSLIAIRDKMAPTPPLIRD